MLVAASSESPERVTAETAHASELGQTRRLVHTQCSLRAWLGQPSVLKLTPLRGPERAKQSSWPSGPGSQGLSGRDWSTGAGHAFWACFAALGQDASTSLARDGPQSKVLGHLAPPGCRSSTASLWVWLTASLWKVRCDGPHGRPQASHKDPRHARSRSVPELKPAPADFCGATYLSTIGGRFGHRAVWAGRTRSQQGHENKGMSWGESECLTLAPSQVVWFEPHHVGRCMGLVCFQQTLTIH